MEKLTSDRLPRPAGPYSHLAVAAGLVFTAGFGDFSGDLLVGNFGDGRINAFQPQPDGHFKFVGQLRGKNGLPISIDGLWGIAFGNGGSAGPATTLFFAAGPDDEAHGLFGRIDVG